MYTISLGAAHVYSILPHTVMEKLMYPRVQCRGLTPFARRNRACVFRKLIRVTLSWNLEFLQNILELRLTPEIPSQIDWHLKIQSTTFLCIKFPPPILIPLQSTRGQSHLEQHMLQHMLPHMWQHMLQHMSQHMLQHLAPHCHGVEHHGVVSDSISASLTLIVRHQPWYCVIMTLCHLAM